MTRQVESRPRINCMVQLLQVNNILLFIPAFYTWRLSLLLFLSRHCTSLNCHQLRVQSAFASWLRVIPCSLAHPRFYLFRLPLLHTFNNFHLDNVPLNEKQSSTIRIATACSAMGELGNLHYTQSCSARRYAITSCAAKRQGDIPPASLPIRDIMVWWQGLMGYNGGAVSTL